MQQEHDFLSPPATQAHIQDHHRRILSYLQPSVQTARFLRSPLGAADPRRVARTPEVLAETRKQQPYLDALPSPPSSAHLERPQLAKPVVI
ncbi:scrapie-responsive protein 1 isoform X3 [Castor canadensis]|uniref:Scrapie-responsive protein 1 isoform X3 n=1 Tax=Castor canadensis TaxID=51338 RepID=A0AC58L1R6_CASCN